MAKNTKTPVMVLTELSIKRGHSAPNFQLVYERCNGHDNEFSYVVEVEGVVGSGTGKSKKDAKHVAAYNALELLKEEGIVHPDFVSSPDKMHKPAELPSPKKSPVNCIATLADLCAEYKLPDPVYEELSDVGPPHCREFTYECHLGSMITRATAGTKKQARHVAAQEMLEKVKDIILEDTSDTSTCLMRIDEEIPEITCNFMRLSNFYVKPNLGEKISNYCMTIPNLLTEKSITFEEVYKFFELPNDKETLDALLETLELKCAIEVIQQDPYIICLNVNLDTPFTTIAMADTAEKAINSVIEDAFKYLKTYTNYQSSHEATS